MIITAEQVKKVYEIDRAIQRNQQRFLYKNQKIVAIHFLKDFLIERPEELFYQFDNDETSIPDILLEAIEVEITFNNKSWYKINPNVIDFLHQQMKKSE